MAVLPMFPLGAVLLPGSVLPLHVFEPRYQQMIRDILADDVNPPEFGVVMIERGWEVGGGEQRTDVGTVARIIDIEALSEGRYALAAVGVERLTVSAWLPDDPYPLADVDRSAPDDSGLTGEVRQRLSDRVAEVHSRIREMNRRAAAMGDAVPDDGTEISSDPDLAVYHLGALGPLGPVDRFRLLAAQSTRERLDTLESALDDASALLDFRST